jgi:hypothetical protein
MQFIAPDILAELRGLSVPLAGVGCALGLLVWLTGWLGHRFWIVLVATVGAGVFGLLSAPANRAQPLAAGLLLAVAAGALALALVRVVAFGAGGFAAWMAVRALAPAGWDEPLLCVLAGGLVGLLLFRVWTMILTSFAGALLMGYFGLCLADSLGKVDAVAFAGGHALLLNGACGGVTLAGLIAQFVLERRRVARLRLWQEREDLAAGRWKRWDRQKRWWGWGARGYRKAV